MDKGKHGFDGQKCAHASSKPLAIQAYERSGYVPMQISDSDSHVFDCNRTAKFSAYADRHDRLAGRSI